MQCYMSIVLNKTGGKNQETQLGTGKEKLEKHNTQNT